MFLSLRDRRVCRVSDRRHALAYARSADIQFVHEPEGDA